MKKKYGNMFFIECFFSLSQYYIKSYFYSFKIIKITIHRCILKQQFTTLEQIYYIYLMNQTINPICHISKKKSTKFCTNPSCTLPAFICKHCQEDDCEKIHFHNKQLKVMSWNQINSKIQNLQDAHEDKNYQEIINKFQKQISLLIVDINSLLQTHLKRINEYKRSLKMNSEFEQVLSNVRSSNFDMINGKQMRLLMDQLENNTYYQNISEVTTKKKQEINFLRNTLDKMRQSMIQYLNNKIVESPIKNTMLEQPPVKTNLEQSFVKINVGESSIKTNIEQSSVKIKIEQSTLKKTAGDLIAESLLMNYNKQLELNKSASNLYEQGLIQKGKNQVEKALDSFTKSIQLNPNNPLPYNKRGLIYLEKNQLQKALIDFNIAINLDPKNQETFKNRGDVYYQMKQLQKAYSDYTKSTQLNPRYSAGYNGKGLIFYDRNQLDYAYQCYIAAINCDNRNQQAYKNRGNVFLKQGNWNKAFADYSKAIEINPNFSLAYNNRAVIYETLQRWDEALKDFTKAIELDKLSKFAYRGRSRVYSKLKMQKEANQDEMKHLQIMMRSTIK